MNLKKINRIFLFGDSWVEGQGTYDSIVREDGILIFEEAPLPYEKIGQWRKENSWNKFIKEITDCEIINFAQQGSDNYAQFQLLSDIFFDLTPNDLVLFGFTSKLRDRKSFFYSFECENDDNEFNILHINNPLKSFIAWEKLTINDYNFGYSKENYKQMEFHNEVEKKFTKNFIKDYFASIYDDYPLEYVAQVNYFFYQERFKSLGLNLVCFDLFEPYVDPNFVKNNYKVDNNVYVTYGNKTMNDYLTEYEIKNCENDEIGVWEWGNKRPDLVGKIFHPNQHGYKIYIDYLFNQILKTKYSFKK